MACNKKAEKRFLDHIRVLSFWIKRGYDSKKAEKVFGPYPGFILSDKTRI
jgi:hypothetical protein